jgi:trigger factor
LKLKEFYIEKNVMHATIAFEAEETNNSFKWAYTELLSSVNVPGFRKGHIPYEVFKSFVDKDRFLSKTITKLYSEALKLLMETKENLNFIDLPRAENPDTPTEGKPYEIKLISEIYPNVSLPEIEEKELEININRDKESILKDKINALLEANATFIEKEGAPEIGDYAVVIHYIEGEGKASGKKETSLIELGKDEIFPGIDKELLNMKEGEEKTIKRKLEDGNEISIHLKIISFKKKVLPILTEDFIKSIGYEGTLEKFIEEKNKEALEEEKKEEKNIQINALFNYLIENSKIEDIPERLIDSYVDEEIESFKNEISESGLTMDEFLEKTNRTPSSLREDFKPKAITKVKVDLILREVIGKEPQLNPDEKEINEKVLEIMGKYKNRDSDKEKIKNWMKNEIAKQKAIDFLLSKVKFKFVKEEVNK